MPVVKIDLRKGNSINFLKDFMDAVHESMVEILKIPSDDRNQKLTQFEDNLFEAKPPYEYFIEIMMFTGRSKETKSKLFKSIVTNLQEKLKLIRKKYLSF